MHGWWAASYVVLWVLVIVLSVMVVTLARQIGTLHTRLGPPSGSLDSKSEGPPLGSALPPIDLQDIDGNPVTLGGPGPQQLLLFISPGCGVCEQILPALPAIARNGQLAPFVITDVDLIEAQREFGGGRVQAPIVSGPEAIQRYQVPGTPYAVILDRLGIVRGKGAIISLDQVEALVDAARGQTGQATT